MHAVMKITLKAEHTTFVTTVMMKLSISEASISCFGWEADGVTFNPVRGVKVKKANGEQKEAAARHL